MSTVSMSDESEPTYERHTMEQFANTWRLYTQVAMRKRFDPSIVVVFVRHSVTGIQVQISIKCGADEDAIESVCNTLDAEIPAASPHIDKYVYGARGPVVSRSDIPCMIGASRSHIESILVREWTEHGLPIPNTNWVFPNGFPTTEEHYPPVLIPYSTSRSVVESVVERSNQELCATPGIGTYRYMQIVGVSPSDIRGELQKHRGGKNGSYPSDKKYLRHHRAIEHVFHFTPGDVWSVVVGDGNSEVSFVGGSRAVGHGQDHAAAGYFFNIMKAYMNQFPVKRVPDHSQGICYYFVNIGKGGNSMLNRYPMESRPRGAKKGASPKKKKFQAKKNLEDHSVESKDE